MITEINIIRATILTIATIITTIVLSYREKSVIFGEKKVVALISIQIMSNGRQKNFGNKIENSLEIKENITHF